MNKNCDWCGNTYTVNKYANGKSRYCGRKCARRSQHFNKLEWNRERNRQWYLDHQQSEIEKNRQYRSENKEKFVRYHDIDRFGGNRKTVLIRDNFTCQVCKSTEKLIIHHIDGTGYTSGAATSNNSLENLITLCTSCHHRLHWYQRKNNVQFTSIEDIVRTATKIAEGVRNVLPHHSVSNNIA